MDRRRLAVVLLAALLLSSGLALAKARGSPDLSVHLPENDLVPGADTTLELRLQNAGDVAYATSGAEQTRVTTARDVRVTLDADDAPLTVESGTQPVGNVPEGLSPAIAFEVSVDEDATPGEYELPVEVSYTYTNVIGSGDGAYHERERTISREVTVEIEDDASFRVVEASAEDLFSTSGPVTVTLENDGSATARDATVSLTSRSGQLTFGGAATARTFVGNWPAGETRTVTVEGQLAAGADRRTYPLDLAVAYRDDDGVARSSETLSTGVAPRAETRFDLSNVESTLVVGEEGTITGTVTNNGGSAARDAVLVLSTNSRNVEPIETEYSLGTLAAGDSTDFSYDVEVSEASAGGPRQVAFQVRYRDRNHDQQRSDQLEARVDVGPQRDVFAVTPLNATIEAGGGDELHLEVTNRGNRPVTDVSAKLFANAPISATDDEAFIDELAPGETRRITFGIAAGGGALSKVYPVSVDFQYDEADGDTLLSDTYQLPIQVTQPSGGGGGPPVLPIALVVVIVVAGAGYVLYRRRSG